MRAIKLLIAIAGAGTLFCLYGYTIPIVEGNQWVYTYSAHISREPRYDTVRTGLFKISIDSVLTRNDSLFFSITTVDSGKSVSKTTDSTTKSTSDSIRVYRSDTHRYLCANDSNFISDSLTKWVTAGWRPSPVPWDYWYLYGGSSAGYLTSYNITLNTSPWFLNYPGPTNSTFYFQYQNYIGYTAYQRNSDSSSYLDGKNSIPSWSYTTGIIDSYVVTKVWAGPSRIINSNFRWLKNIGLASFGENITTINQGSLNGGLTKIIQQDSAIWTLISFNGTPVTLPSNKIMSANPKRHVAKTSANPYRKAVLLEGRHSLPNSSSSGMYNIRGQQLGRIQTMQIIIIKDR